jgi:hypothetical protein
VIILLTDRPVCKPHRSFSRSRELRVDEDAAADAMRIQFRTTHNVAAGQTPAPPSALRQAERV